MSNTGYGNHDEPPPGKAADDAKATPAPKATRTPPLPTDTHISTPGDGAGPDAPVGKDVDPDVG